MTARAATARAARVLVLFGAMVALGAAPAARRNRVAGGTWGGDHIGLQVTDAGASVEYDCAHGTIDAPMELDRRGRFDVKGFHVKEHGGPGRAGAEPDRHPARYTGQTDGKTLSLTVVLTDTSERLGSFTLGYGAAPRLRKCL